MTEFGVKGCAGARATGHDTKAEHIQVAETMASGGCDGNEQRNPRNWRPWKKRLLFFALMSSSILADGYVFHHFLHHKRNNNR